MTVILFSKRVVYPLHDAPDIIWQSQDADKIHFLCKEPLEPGMILLPNSLEFGFTAYQVKEVLRCEHQGDRYRTAIANYEPYFCTVSFKPIDLEPKVKLIRTATLKGPEITLQPQGFKLVGSFALCDIRTQTA